MNKQVFDLTGITAMHERGITGEGVRVLVHERDKDSNHSYMSADIIKQIAPKATVERWHPSQQNYQGDVDAKYPQYDVINRSFSGDHTVDKARYNTLIVSASGNSADHPSRDVLDMAVIGVGAVTLATNGKVYHDEGGWNKDGLPMEQAVEFVGFTNLMTYDGLYSGTSCAAPFVSGILALIASDYNSKGFKLDLTEARRLLEAMSVKDIHKTNHYVYQNPHTKEKQIRGYREGDEIEVDPRKIGYGYPNLVGYVSPFVDKSVDKNIRLTIGSSVIYIDGAPKSISVPPLIINGTTVLPLRVIAEALDLNVEWDAKTKTVTLRRTHGR
jgi:hypothetical protein